MKHVTIRSPSLSTSQPVTPAQDNPSPNGIPLPKHMVPPGHEGYRTPTAEDYERADQEPTEKSGGNIPMPFRFPGLYAIGIIFFLLNIVLFLVNVAMISLRFYSYPETFKASILHPTERLFMPAAIVSFGTILLNISQYGPNHGPGHWLNDAITVLFWIDAALAILASMGVYLVMWSTQSFTISNMTPVWIFPAYPLLIVGPHASVLSKSMPQPKAFDVIVGGFTLQGIGFMVSLMIYSAFIYRLMTQKLPREAARPGMFVSVGPSAFTVAAMIGMAENAKRALPPDFMGDDQLAAKILTVIASWNGVRNELVLICVSEYSSDYRDVRHWENFSVQRDPNGRVRDDANSYHDLDYRVLDDDQGDILKTDFVASERRRQGRGGFKGPRRRTDSM
ncbi:uncharacterized protein KY384_005333 [Bacidia gigantensis]|uniref:uncharacterized protein n=1 Tax=Bacidia gigantensis TaxID=2732470 RepID=UPI001D059287|nr:uncharacterized protein KY384_005333 [Bacidia gigantensis]KAG8529852.1 hypothetical protein KY384_005333 [Bacidia gigantensis]